MARSARATAPPQYAPAELPAGPPPMAPLRTGFAGTAPETFFASSPADGAAFLVWKLYYSEGTRTLIHPDGGFYRWVDGAWQAVSDAMISAQVYHLCTRYARKARPFDGNLCPVQPTPKLVSSILSCLRCLVFYPPTNFA